MDPSTVHVIKNPNGDSERPIAYQTPTPTFTPPPPIVPIESPTYHTGATSSTNLVASGGESTSRKKRHSSALGEKHQQLQSHLKEHLEKFERKRKRKQSVLISEHTYLPNGNGSSNNSQPVSTGVIGADESDNGIGLCGWLLTMISWALVLVTMPFSLFVCFKVVQEYERAVIFRLGRLLSGGSKGPGIFFVLPCIESYQKVDLRTITLGVPPQEVLTKDSVTVSVDAVVYYRVSNATVSVANVENAHHSTRLLAQTTLRNILGTKNLHEILSDRESISGSMQVVLDEATTAWGIKVERVEIKDARLPVQLQRAMAAEAEAAREARAKVIAAEGEQKASRALKEASEVIAESSSALQLRYLQTLNSISAEKNSTIIFPLPIDFITNLLNKKKMPIKTD